MWRHFLQYLPGATIAYFLRLDHNSEAIPSARIHQKTLPMFCIRAYLLLSLQTKIDPVIYRQSSSFGVAKGRMKKRLLLYKVILKYFFRQVKIICSFLSQNIP